MENSFSKGDAAQKTSASTEQDDVISPKNIVQSTLGTLSLGSWWMRRRNRDSDCRLFEAW